MNIIYLKNEKHEWIKFEYSSMCDIQKEFEIREISIGANTVIGTNVSIGNKSSIGNGSSVGNGTSIEDMSHIWDLVKIGAYNNIGQCNVIDDGSTIGDNNEFEKLVRVGKGSNIMNGNIIGYDVKIRDAVNIGNRNFIGYESSIGDYSRIIDDCVIENGNAIFALNLYKYAVSGYLSKDGSQIIQLGSDTRKRTEWDSDEEFKNDNSKKSKAYKTICFFLDNVKK